MKVAASTEDNNQPWRFRDALRLKAGLKDEEIEKLFTEMDHLDLVEYAMALEEEWGIEICDEDLFQEGSGQNPEDPLN
jgi:acyl carrier protein